MGTSKGNLHELLLPKAVVRTRSNGYTVDKCRFRNEMGRNWFTNRVVNERNKVDNYVVEVNTFDSFRCR